MFTLYYRITESDGSRLDLLEEFDTLAEAMTARSEMLESDEYSHFDIVQDEQDESDETKSDGRTTGAEVTQMMYYTLPGLYDDKAAQRIKRALQDETYMRFDVCVSGQKWGRTITVSTECEASQSGIPATQTDFEDMVIFVLANAVN